jgi:hypothetical protein
MGEKGRKAIMSNIRTTTQIYLNRVGECWTRLWYGEKVGGEVRQAMREIRTPKKVAKSFMEGRVNNG